jgi:hypothetical protein
LIAVTPGLRRHAGGFDPRFEPRDPEHADFRCRVEAQSEEHAERVSVHFDQHHNVDRSG